MAVATAADPGNPGRQGLAGRLPPEGLATGRRPLGLAIFTAIATSHTQHLLVAHAPVEHAVIAGFQRPFFVGSILILVARGNRAARHQHRRGCRAPPAAVALALLVTGLEAARQRIGVVGITVDS